MKQKAKPAQPAPRKARHDPEKTAANRARRIATEAKRQAEARQRKAEHALTHGRALRRAQEQTRVERILDAVYAHGVAAEVHHLIKRAAQH